jgi:hypothetical protein
VQPEGPLPVTPAARRLRGACATGQETPPSAPVDIQSAGTCSPSTIAPSNGPTSFGLAAGPTIPLPMHATGQSRSMRVNHCRPRRARGWLPLWGPARPISSQTAPSESPDDPAIGDRAKMFGDIALAGGDERERDVAKNLGRRQFAAGGYDPGLVVFPHRPTGSPHPGQRRGLRGQGRSATHVKPFLSGPCSFSSLGRHCPYGAGGNCGNSANSGLFFASGMPAARMAAAL